MALVSNKLRYRSELSEIRSEANIYQEERDLVFDTVTDEAAARAAAPYALGSSGPVPGAFLESVSYSPTAPTAWKVTLRYSTKAQRTNEDEPPEERRPRRPPRLGYWQDAVTRHVDGRPKTHATNPNQREGFFSSAGGSLANDIKRVVAYPTRTAFVYFVGDEPPDFSDKIGDVNLDNFKLHGVTYKPFTVMLANVIPEPAPATESGATAWWLAFDFRMNFAKAPPGKNLNGQTTTGYIRWLPDEDTMVKKDGKRRLITDGAGNPTGTIEFLDGAGGLLAESELTEIVYLDCLPYDASNFTSALPAELAKSPYGNGLSSL